MAPRQQGFSCCIPPDRILTKWLMLTKAIIRCQKLSRSKARLKSLPGGAPQKHMQPHMAGTLFLLSLQLLPALITPEANLRLRNVYSAFHAALAFFCIVFQNWAHFLLTNYGTLRNGPQLLLWIYVASGVRSGQPAWRCLRIDGHCSD